MSLKPLSASRWPRAAWFWPFVFALAAWVGIVTALDPAGDHPGSFAGPGLTVDEAFNVGQGVALVDRLLSLDLAGFRQVDARLTDHPPLGRVVIGLCHELAFLVFPPSDSNVAYSVTCARTAPATAFAILVTIIGTYAGRCYGRCGGASAAMAVVLMPRLFGHAHLAALETMINLSATGAVLYVAAKWSGGLHWPVNAVDVGPELPAPSSNPMLGTAAFGGLLFGLALLTKVQAVLLPVPICLWTLWHLRRRGVILLAAWGLTGLAVFLIFWPHLWNAPLDHVREYLGRTTDRAVLYVWYFGQVIADRDVPWHYPWLMFLATVPVGLHALGAWGLFHPNGGAWHSPREQLLLACIVFPLCVFSIPGVAVYDGERLFSFIFPLWAVLIGRGAEGVWRWASHRFSQQIAAAGLTVFFAAQSIGLISLSPCWLSYYNLVVGGLSGAARQGLEISYWGDGVTRELLAAAAERAPAGGTVAVMPALHPFQWQEVWMQSPALRARDIHLVPWGMEGAAQAEYVLMFVRPEYLPEEFRPPLDEKRIVASVRRQGVPLAVLLDRRQPELSQQGRRK